MTTLSTVATTVTPAYSPAPASCKICFPVIYPGCCMNYLSMILCCPFALCGQCVPYQHSCSTGIITIDEEKNAEFYGLTLLWNIREWFGCSMSPIQYLTYNTPSTTFENGERNELFRCICCINK